MSKANQHLNVKLAVKEIKKTKNDKKADKISKYCIGD